MGDTFTCDSCANEFPRNQLKEVFTEEGTERLKEQLCPSCLDRRMNESPVVKGVVGEEKTAAVRLTDGEAEKAGERDSLGVREG